jgi:Flp pilus assembly pilin Flp
MKSKSNGRPRNVRLRNGGSLIFRLQLEEAGQDIVEYSMLLVLLGIVAVLILTGMGLSISRVWQKITTAFQAADTMIP